MTFNYSAAIAWAFLACIGWLIGDAKGAVSGLAVGLFLSLFFEFIDTIRK